LVTDIGTLIDPFGNNMAGTLKGFIFIDNVLVEVFGGNVFNFIASLCHNDLGQRLQSIFSCGLGLGLFALLEWEI